MRTAGLVLMLAISWPSLWRETSSHAASRRGTEAYREAQYGAATRAFGDAQSLAPSARGAYNLGTSQIAAGDLERGSAALAPALRDPELRADALFNRGNGALAAQSYDHAIRDYIDALRVRPDHADAKRNLEIALARRQQSQRPDPGGQRGQQGQSNQRQPQSTGEGKRPEEAPLDLDALLRSVQQQEEEELRRMKGSAAETKVGW